MALLWQQIPRDWQTLVYSSRTSEDEKRCIGHMRIDFGRSGKEFWSSWFDHNPQLKDIHFRMELEFLINRERLEGNLLHDFNTMRKLCREGLLLERDEYGLYLVTQSYEFYIRCIPRRGDYNAYLYCYKTKED